MHKYLKKRYTLVKIKHFSKTNFAFLAKLCIIYKKVVKKFAYMGILL